MSEVIEYIEANYRKLEGQTRESVIDAFEAGQQSQQAKIDELQRKIAFQEKAIKNIKLQFENKQIDCDRSDRKIDELQARIDCLSKKFNDLARLILDECEDILKGNKDETGLN